MSKSKKLYAIIYDDGSLGSESCGSIEDAVIAQDEYDVEYDVVELTKVGRFKLHSVVSKVSKVKSKKEKKK